MIKIRIIGEFNKIVELENINSFEEIVTTNMSYEESDKLIHDALLKQHNIYSDKFKVGFTELV
jgi:hypothetical protein